jgi:hypothetical protein
MSSMLSLLFFPEDGDSKFLSDKLVQDYKMLHPRRESKFHIEFRENLKSCKISYIQLICLQYFVQKGQSMSSFCICLK